MLPDGILRFGEPARMDEVVLSSREAAVVLRMSPGTLVRWRKEGVGPSYVRMGGRIMYRPFAIQQWLTACTVAPEDDNHTTPEIVAAFHARQTSPNEPPAPARRVPNNLGELIADAFARADAS